MTDSEAGLGCCLVGLLARALCEPRREDRLTESEAKTEAYKRWGDTAAIRLSAQPKKYSTGKTYWDWKY